MLQKALTVPKFIFYVHVLLLLFGTSTANFAPEIEFSTHAYSFDPDIIYIRRNTDIADCVGECKEATSCRFINFSRRSNVCVMSFFVSDIHLVGVHKEKKAGMTCWLKPLNHVNDAYYGSDQSLCGLTSPATPCEARYCKIPVDIGPFKRYGNMYTVGSQQAYACLNHSTHTWYKEGFYCDINGHWTMAPPPCSYSNVIDFGNSKIIFYFSADKVIQSTASSRCEMDKARLVQITTHSKLDVLRKNFRGDRFSGLWLDAHRLRFMKWRTSDSEDIPINLFEVMSGLENCAMTNERWHLDPTDCENERRYVCEITV